jgi:hypothetical protein
MLTITNTTMIQHFKVMPDKFNIAKFCISKNCEQKQTTNLHNYEVRVLANHANFNRTLEGK